MKAEQELREAARLIRKHGWTRGQYENLFGALCMSGACTVARGVPFTKGPSQLARLHLMKVTGYFFAFDFNDIECKTANDAIAALEIAADLAA